MSAGSLAANWLHVFVFPSDPPSSSPCHDLPFVPLRQPPPPPAAFPLSHTLSSPGPSSLLPGWWPHKALVRFAHWEPPGPSTVCMLCLRLLHLSWLLNADSRLPLLPSPRKWHASLLWGGSFPSSWASPFRYPQMCSGFLVSVIWIMFHPLPDIPLCCSLLIRSHLIFGADPPSSLKQSWISPQRSHCAGLWMALILLCIRCLSINHTLACDISCTALSCYLSLVYSFTFLHLCLIFLSSLRAESRSLTFFFPPLVLLACLNCPISISGISRFNLPQVSPTFLL